METDRLFQYEQLGRSHWWLTSKYAVLRDVLCHRVDEAALAGPVLDVGCAGGVFLDVVRDVMGRQFGLDYDPEILLRRGSSDVGKTAADAQRLPYRDASFSVVTAIDIIEHLPDDAGALAECHRVLRPNGWLLVCVPAFMALFGRHDALFGHIRRYRRGPLHGLIESAGFSVDLASYIQPLFFAPLWAKRRLLPAKDDLLGDFRMPPRWLNRVLHHALALERYALRRMAFPIGATLILLAQKKSKDAPVARPLRSRSRTDVVLQY